MSNLQLKFKRLTADALIPKYATDGSGCIDLAVPQSAFADHVEGLRDVSQMVLPRGDTIALDIKLAVEVPEGHVMLIFSRSGHGFNHNVRLSNCVGVIDSDYRGSIGVKLKSDDGRPFTIRSGDRIAQALVIPIPRLELIEVETLSDTVRGTGGLGSTNAPAPIDKPVIISRVDEATGDTKVSVEPAEPVVEIVSQAGPAPVPDEPVVEIVSQAGPADAKFGEALGGADDLFNDASVATNTGGKKRK